MTDIREMTLGEIEEVVLKQYMKVDKAHYWLYDKKEHILNIINEANKAVLYLMKHQKFIIDDKVIDEIIKDFQTEPEFK